MSRVVVETADPARHVGQVVPSAGILVAGTALLLLRPFALGRPTAALVIGGTYVALAAMSVSIAMPGTSPALVNPLLVLAIGTGAIALGALVSGPHIPFPVGSGALVLNPLAALAEEAFFRRFVFGRLAPRGPAVAILVTGVLFALVHVPLYGVAAIWVDLGAGLLLSWQRWASGRWTVPAATHVFANLLAVMR